MWLSPLSLLARLITIAPKGKVEKNSIITKFQFLWNLQKHHNAHNNIPKKIFVMSLKKKLRKNEEGGCNVWHPLPNESFNKATIEEAPCGAW